MNNYIPYKSMGVITYPCYTIHPKEYPHRLHFVKFCGELIYIAFTHILQGCFTGIGAIESNLMNIVYKSHKHVNKTHEYVNESCEYVNKSHECAKKTMLYIMEQGTINLYTYFIIIYYDLYSRLFWYILSLIKSKIVTRSGIWTCMGKNQ